MSFPAISAQFTFKVCAAAKNRKKINKIFYFVGPRLFKVIAFSANGKRIRFDAVAECDEQTKEVDKQTPLR